MTSDGGSHFGCSAGPMSLLDPEDIDNEDDRDLSCSSRDEADETRNSYSSLVSRNHSMHALSSSSGFEKNSFSSPPISTFDLDSVGDV
jgi:hypothetical protein